MHHETRHYDNNCEFTYVLFMSLYSLYMLTTRVCMFYHFIIFFCNSLYQLLISYVLRCFCQILISLLTYLLTLKLTEPGAAGT